MGSKPVRSNFLHIFGVRKKIKKKKFPGKIGFYRKNRRFFADFFFPDFSIAKSFPGPPKSDFSPKNRPISAIFLSLPLTKPRITQVYSWSLHPPVSSPPSATSTSDPFLNDDLPIALHKGKRQCTIQSHPSTLITICHPTLVHLLHPWTLCHCLTRFLKP